MNGLDVLVVGGGPAGLAAAIHLVRAGRAIRVFERNRPGGLLRNAHWIENYPGFPDGIRGVDLAARFRDQALNRGVVIERADIRRLRASKESGFLASAGGMTIRAAAVIVASGTRPKTIRLPGGAPLLGRRIFYEMAEAEAEGINGRRALVIGGGDAAFDYAIQWRDRGGAAAMIVRSVIRALPLLAGRAGRLEIPVFCGAAPLRVTESPGGIRLSFRFEGKIHHHEADLVLIACGRVPDLSGLDASLRTMIRPDAVKTGYPGLFGAGDVIRGRRRQTGIAVGDGLRAAMEAAAYLDRGE